MENNEVLAFIEERAYDLYSFAHEEAECWERDKPFSFKNAWEKQEYYNEINRLLKLSYKYLDLSDELGLINRKISYRQ